MQVQDGATSAAGTSSWHIGEKVHVFSETLDGWFLGEVLDLVRGPLGLGARVEFEVQGVRHRKAVSGDSDHVLRLSAPAEVRAERLVRIQELRAPGRGPRAEVDPGSCCIAREIAAMATAGTWKTEDRGITVPQLEALLQYIDLHCAAERWTSSNPASPEAALDPESINLYDVVRWVVKPVTQLARCSYVEWASLRAQVPLWYVSHWWGEAVSNFVKCLQQHRQDRKLPEDAPYWVCAYANTQWDAASEVGDDPAQSSFRRAMAKAQGTVTVLDQAATTFTRVWCAYEIYISLIVNSSGGYLYDIYTVDRRSSKAVGLTDGPAAIDGGSGADGAKKLGNQCRREQSFPLELGLAALDIQVQSAEASVEEDRMRILNSIVGATDLNSTPPSQHAGYLRVNSLLRGRFAAGIWCSVFENGCVEDIRRCSRALRESGLETMALNCISCKQVGARVDLLIQALPQFLECRLRNLALFLNDFGDGACGALAVPLRQLEQLSSVTLVFGLTSSIGEEGGKALAAAVAGLQQLHSLTLDLSLGSCIRRGGTKALAAAVGKLWQLSSLELKLPSNSIGDEGVKALAEAVVKLRRLISFALDVRCNGIREEGGKALAAAVAELQHLDSLELSLRSNSLGEEGAKALAGAVVKLRQLSSLTLKLGRTCIGEEGGKALAAAVVDQRQLSRLELTLAGNGLGQQGTSALARAVAGLRQLNSLTLVLLENNVGDEGVKALAAALAELRQLRLLALTLARNGIGLEGARALAAAVAELRQLSTMEINLKHNDIGEEGKSRLRQAGSRLEKHGARVVFYF